MIEFACNVCGARNRIERQSPDREGAKCSSCGSSARVRGLVRALSLELFGINLPLPDFPRLKNIRGLGLSDAAAYAGSLAEKFDYRNTFYDRDPRFDVTAPPQSPGAYDFLLASDVFEHVAPPVEAAFRNAFALLAPGGILAITVPYSLDPATREHFPELNDFGLAQLSGGAVLVNRTRSGELQVFENLVFHVGCEGNALELREFSESGLKSALALAGFTEVRLHSEEDPSCGVFHEGNWSLPVTARKGAAVLRADAVREIVEQWRHVRQTHDGEMKRLCASFWFRLGRKLRLF